MATSNFVTSTSKASIPGLTQGKSYVAQNCGSRTILLAESSSAPADAFQGHRVLPDHTLSILKSAESIYAWCEGGTSVLAITES